MTTEEEKMEEKERKIRMEDFVKRELEAMIETEKKIAAGNISDLPIGYVPDFAPRADFRERGLLCPYEHCIELMPLAHSGPTEKNCPMWGHDCPGGTNQIEACKSN